MNTVGELVDLFEAQQYANREIIRHAVRHGLQGALLEGD